MALEFCLSWPLLGTTKVPFLVEAPAPISRPGASQGHPMAAAMGLSTYHWARAWVDEMSMVASAVSAWACSLVCVLLNADRFQRCPSPLQLDGKGAPRVHPALQLCSW